MHGGVWEIGQGCWQVCRQVHLTPLHMYKDFPTQMQKQMTVTSSGDVTDVLLTYIMGGYKSECVQDPGFSFWLVQSFLMVFFLACCPVSSSGKLQTLSLS